MKKNNFSLYVFLGTVALALVVNLTTITDAKANSGKPKYCYKSNPNHHCGKGGSISCGQHQSNGNQ
ncbi:MAG: hypothetical protein SFU91_03535 [Chloroherpetonaceae bacterium]|nr:hypothetical protein [Chloroherpetonaceae bacterium]